MSVSTTAPARPVSADRRSFLAAGMATVVAVSVAAPAVAAITQDDPVTAYWNIHTAYNNSDTVTEAEYLNAHRRMREWEPKTERDFVRQFVARFDDGNWSGENPMSGLVAEASRLLGDM